MAGLLPPTEELPGPYRLPIRLREPQRDWCGWRLRITQSSQLLATNTPEGRCSATMETKAIRRSDDD